jgi:uncharacterized repeat protein (TIGR03803 family)
MSKIMTPKDRRTRFPFTRAASLAILLGTYLSESVHAQYTYSTIANLDAPYGTNPHAGLALDANGNLYGTTENGGENGYGTVFKVAAGTHQLSVVTSFDGTHGSNPFGGVIVDATGNLYGTAQYGGDNGFGTVYKIAAGTNNLTTLVSFDGTSHGSNPYAGLAVDTNGNLYGTTQNGGANGYGVVFKVAAGTNSMTALASFDGTPHGSNPWSGVIRDASGNLYGTTYSGGANGLGTVYKVAAGTNQLTTLASFDGTPHGSYSYGSLVADPAGNLYGTTYVGGASGFGTVFKVAAGTNTFTNLHSFDDVHGSNSRAGLMIDASGNLYGTTQYDAFNYGTIFKMAAGTNAFTVLKLFDGTAGIEPYGNLIADAAGNLYGTTYTGGTHGYGVVFMLAAPAIPGDYNSNGVIDAADYVVWRKTLGQTGANLPADGSHNNQVDSADYSVWRARFGNTSGSGAGTVAATTIPEPKPLPLLGLAVFSLAPKRRHAA